MGSDAIFYFCICILVVSFHFLFLVNEPNLDVMFIHAIPVKSQGSDHIELAAGEVHSVR